MTGLQPLTVATLAGVLLAWRAGRDADAVRLFETATAVTVHAHDVEAPEAVAFQSLSNSLARGMARPGSVPTGDLLTESLRRACERFTRDHIVIKLPASVAVQGVEYEDLHALAEAVESRVEPGCPLLVIGVRTGGAYLAPVLAEYLRIVGHDVVVRTVRPGAGASPRLGSCERTVVLVDDPPLTGSALIRVKTTMLELAAAAALVAVPCIDSADLGWLSHELQLDVVGVERSRWRSSTRFTHTELRSTIAETNWADGGGDREFLGIVAGRKCSTLHPWPELRHRSAPKAAVFVSGPGGPLPVALHWTPPGIFGDATRYAADRLRPPQVPQHLGAGRAWAVSAWLPEQEGSPGPEAALKHVATRARPLALPWPDAFISDGSELAAMSHTLWADNADVVAKLLRRGLNTLPPSLPDNRCQPEKFRTSAGRLVKYGALGHAYRRDNHLFSALADFVGWAVTYDQSFDCLCDAIENNCECDVEATVLAAAAGAVYYAAIRGEQLGRTYSAATRGGAVTRAPEKSLFTR